MKLVAVAASVPLVSHGGDLSNAVKVCQKNGV